MSEKVSLMLKMAMAKGWDLDILISKGVINLKQYIINKQQKFKKTK